MEQQYLILVTYMVKNKYLNTETKFAKGEETAIKYVEELKDKYSNTFCQVDVYEIEKVRTYTGGLEHIK